MLYAKRVDIVGHMHIHRVALILTLILCSRAGAESTAGYTAEWLSHDSFVIAIATPVKATVTKGPGQVWFTHISLKVDERIKGPLLENDTLTVHHYSRREADPLEFQLAVEKGKKLLVYCSIASRLWDEINGKFAMFGGGKLCLFMKEISGPRLLGS